MIFAEFQRHPDSGHLGIGPFKVNLEEVVYVTGQGRDALGNEDSARLVLRGGQVLIVRHSPDEVMEIMLSTYRMSELGPMPNV